MEWRTVPWFIGSVVHREFLPHMVEKARALSVASHTRAKIPLLSAISWHLHIGDYVLTHELRGERRTNAQAFRLLQRLLCVFHFFLRYWVLLKGLVGRIEDSSKNKLPTELQGSSDGKEVEWQDQSLSGFPRSEGFPRIWEILAKTSKVSWSVISQQLASQIPSTRKRNLPLTTSTPGTRVCSSKSAIRRKGGRSQEDRREGQGQNYRLGPTEDIACPCESKF